MSNPFTRAGLLLAASACLAGPLFSQSADTWCKLVNASDKDWVFTISDDLAAVGKLYVRTPGDTTPGTKLSSKKDSMVIKAKTTYEFNVDTTLGSLAITARFVEGKNYTDLNFKKAPGSDTRFTIITNNPSLSLLKLDVSAFQATGQAFITLD